MLVRKRAILATLGEMRHTVFATDYDGTLASDGVVAPHTIEALDRLKARGWRLVLVTGRLLEELEAIFPALHMFDRVVAENGPVLFSPATGETRLLASPPPPGFVATLAAAGCTPLQAGHVVVSTREPWSTTVLDVVRAEGLELQIIFNKGAVMCLPPGANKGAGLAASLAELGARIDETVAIGDAENDHSLLHGAGFAVAVANAVPTLKEAADFATHGRAGEGVVELIELLLNDGLGPYLEAADGRRAGDAVAVGASASGSPEDGEA